MIRLGGITIDSLRPWTLFPDPAKCNREHDLVGILVQDYKRPPQLIACYPGDEGSVYWWTSNLVPGLGGGSPTPFSTTLWREVLVHPGGWVWLSEPRPLTWIEDPPGTWTAPGLGDIPDNLWTIKQRVPESNITDGEGTTYFRKGETLFVLDGPTLGNIHYRDINEARRVAASQVRTLYTETTEAP